MLLSFLILFFTLQGFFLFVSIWVILVLQISCIISVSQCNNLFQTIYFIHLNYFYIVFVLVNKKIYYMIYYKKKIFSIYIYIYYALL